MPDKNLYDTLRDNSVNSDNVTFDDTLRQDEINSVLGDTKPVVNNNLDILNSNVSSPAFSFNDEEKKAREEGALDASINVPHVDYNEALRQRKRERQNTINESAESAVANKPDIDINTALPGAPSLNDLVNAGIVDDDNGTDYNPAAIYKKLLGTTEYEDLKYKCGLGKYDSFTSYYNRTHYVPKGYETAARLLLAEERRQSLYVDVITGEKSMSDFLYEAYGKDLLKEQGYDFSNKLYWYNRYSEGKYDNPLDNDLLLAQIMDSATALFKDEKWFEKATNAKMSETLAGIVVGETLSDEKVYSLFKNQIDALDEYFHDDYKQVITAYQAGNLNSVFNPFIDIDGDGKYDYYYHINGKMYAINNSSGVGRATADITYNYDDKGNITGIHSVEINEGAEGAFGGFIEGLGGFVGSLFELVSMVDNLVGIQAFVHLVNGDYTQGKKTFWVDGMQDYKAFMSRTFSNDDMQIFDNTHEWGYEVSKSVGTITGQIIVQAALAVATYGAGNAAYTGGQVAMGAAKAVGSGIVKGLVGAAIGAAAGTGVGAITEGIQANQQNREFNAENMFSMTLAGTVAGFGVGFSSGLTQGLNSASAEIANLAQKGLIHEATNVTARSVLGKMAGAIARVSQFLTKGNSGAIFSSASIAGRVGNAAILAAKDFGQTAYNLAVTNRVLKYLSENTSDGEIEPLSDAEILLRAGGAALADLLISSTLRLQDKYGVTSVARRAKGALTNEVEVAGVKMAYRSLTESQKAMFSIMADSLPKSIINAGIDSAFDVVENILTTATSAALNNPYAKFGSPEMRETFFRSMITPQSVIQNLYVTYRNIASTPGNESIFRQRQQALLFSEIPAVRDKAVRMVTSIMNTTDNPELARTMRMVLQEFNARCGYTSGENGAIESNVGAPFGQKGIADNNYYSKTLDGLKYLSEIFDADTISKMSKEDKAKMFTALGINEDDWNKLLKTSVLLGSKIEGLDVRAYNKKVKKGEIQDNMSNIFMAMVFDGASKKNADFLINEANHMMKMWGEVYEDDHKFLKSVFLRGVHDTVNTPENKKAQEDGLKGFLKVINEAADEKIRKEIVGVANLDAAYEYVQRKLLPEELRRAAEIMYNKYVDIDVVNALEVLSQGTMRYEYDDKTGKYNVVYNSPNGNVKPDSKTIKLFSNIDFVNELIDAGILKRTDDQNGSGFDLSILNKSFVCVSFKKDMLNEMRQDKNVQALLEAYHTLAQLAKTKNDKGEYIFNSDAPIMIEAEVDYDGADGKSKQTLFVIPTIESKEGITYSDAARIEAANTLVTALYTLKQSGGDRNYVTKAFQTLGYFNIYGTVDGITRGTDNKSIDLDALTPEEQEILRLKGIATILQITDFKNVDEKKPGFSRDLLIAMIAKNYITKADIEKIITEYETPENKNTSAVTTVAYNNAKNVSKYIDTLAEIQGGLDVLSEFDKAARDGNKMSIGPGKMNKLKNLLTKVHDPKNEWLKEALLQDGMVTNKIMYDLISNKEMALPFLKGLEGTAQTLAHSKTSQSDYLEEELSNQCNELLNNLANKYAQNYKIQTQREYVEVFKSKLRGQIQETYANWKAQIDRTKESVSQYDNDFYDTFKKKTLEIVNHKMKGASIKNKEYTKLVNETTITRVKSILDNNTSVEKAYRELADLWDDIEYNDIRLEQLDKQIAENEASEENKHFKENANNLMSRFFKGVPVEYREVKTDNTLGIWNFVSNFYEADDAYGMNSSVKQFHIENKEFHDRAAKVYYEKTAIESLRSSLIELTDFVNQQQGRQDLIENRNQRRLFNVTNTVFREIIALNENDLSKFFDNPFEYFVNRDIEIQNDASISKAQKKLFKELFNELKQSFTTKTDLMLFTLKALDDDAPENVDDLVAALTSQDGSVVKTYVSTILKLSDGNYSAEDIKADDLSISDTGELLYKGKSVADILRDSKATSIITYTSDEYRMKLDEDYKLYNKFRNEGTKLIANPRVVEVNVLDFIPSNRARLIRLFTECVDLATNKKNEAKLKANQIEINKLLSNSGYGNLTDTQIQFAINMVNNAIENNCFTYTVNLDDANAVATLKKMIGLLGYDSNDIYNFFDGTESIDGLTLKDAAVTGIETKINYDQLMTLLNQRALDTFERESEGAFAKLQKKDIVENSFRSLWYVDNNSLINISEDGKPIRLYGIHNIFSEDSITSDIGASTEIFQMFIKKGLSAGLTSKNTTQLDTGFTNSDVDETSRNTYNVLRIINEVKDYFDAKQAAQQEFISFKVSSKQDAIALLQSAKSFESRNKSTLYKVEDNIQKLADGSYKVDFKLDRSVNLDEIEITDKFDIKSILPLYLGSQYLMPDSNQSLIERIIQLGIEGFDSLEALTNKTNIQVYNTNYKEYEDFYNQVKNQDGSITVGNLLNVKLSDEQNKNYWIRTLLNYVVSAKNYYAEATKQQVSQLKDTILNDKLIRGIVVTLIEENPDLYEDVWNGTASDELLNQFASDVLSKYNQTSDYVTSNQDKIRDNITNFNAVISSGSASKLNLFTTRNITTEDLTSALKEYFALSNFKRRFFVVDNAKNYRLPKANPINMLISLFDVDENGNALFNLDALDNLTLKDLSLFVQGLSDIADDTDAIKQHFNVEDATEVSNMIKDLRQKVSDKIELLRQMNSYKDKDTKEVSIKYNPAAPNAVSVEIVNQILAGAELDEDSRNILLELSENRILARKPQKKFVHLSNMYEEENNQYAKLNAFYQDLLNENLLYVVDKQGHMLVRNMNQNESVGAYMNSLVSFSALLKENNTFGLDQFKLTNKQINNLLLKISMLAEQYSTGTTVAAEFSGALMITLNKDFDTSKLADDEFDFDGFLEVKPIVESATDPELSLGGNLLLSDNNLAAIGNEQNKTHTLLMLNKNTFASNLAGYDEEARYIDLDNEENRINLYRHFINVAKERVIRDNIDLENKTTEDVLLDVYKLYPTYQQRTEQLMDVAKQAHIPEAVVRQIPVKLQRLNVASPNANWNEQRFNTYVKSFINALDLDLNNDQRQVLEDAFFHAITYNALSDNGKAVLENYRNQMIINTDDSLIDLANRIALESDTKENIKKELAALSDEDKVRVIKLAMLKNKKGKDLEYIMNLRKPIEIRRAITNAIEKSGYQSMSYVYDKTTGMYTTEPWQSKRGANINVVNATKSGKFIVADPEWGVNKTNSGKIYQYAFLLCDALPDNAKTADDVTFTRHNIIIEEAISEDMVNRNDVKDKSKQTYYVEDSRSFETKRAWLKNKNAKIISEGGVTYRTFKTNGLNEKDGPLDTTVYIVKNEEDAFNLLNILTKDVKTLIGSNNKAEGSDDERVNAFEGGREVYNRVDNIDLRSDMLHAFMFNEDSINGLNSDSMDTLRTIRDSEGNLIIPEQKTAKDINGRVAHDALSDVIDELNLYLYLRNHISNINQAYDSKYRELSDLGLSDEVIMKALDYSDLNKDSFKDEGDKELIETISSHDKLKSNTIIKGLFEAFQLSEDIKSQRADKKFVRRTIAEQLNPYNSSIRANYLDDVRDFEARKDKVNLVYGLMKTVLPSLEEALNEIQVMPDKRGVNINLIRDAYLKAESLIQYAAYLFKSDENNEIIKDYYNDVVRLNKMLNRDLYISQDEATQMFLSAGKETITKYINKAIDLSKNKASEFKKIDTLHHDYFNEDAGDFFTRNYITDKVIIDGVEEIVPQSLVEFLNSNDVVSYDINEEDSVPAIKAKNKFYATVIGGLDKSFKESGLYDAAPEFCDLMINNLARVQGEIDYGERTRRIDHKKNILSFRSNFDNDMSEFMRKVFSSEDGLFYTSKALYYMGTEKGEFSKSIISDDVGEYGVVYIGKDLLKRAFNINAEVGNEMYANVWRQPGEGKTMHVVKLKVEDGNAFRMTRSTNVSFFNGDSDGDKSFINKPDDVAQSYGETMWKYYKAGGSLLNAFKDVTLKQEIKSYDENIVDNYIRNNLDNFLTVYKAFKEKKGTEEAVRNLKAQFVTDMRNQGLADDDIEDAWEFAGIHPMTLTTNGLSEYYLYTVDNVLYSELMKNADRNPAYAKFANAIKEGAQKRIFTNQYVTDYDSQLVGQIAKRLTNKASDLANQTMIQEILFFPDIAITKSSRKQLSAIISSINDINAVKSKLIATLDESKDVLKTVGFEGDKTLYDVVKETIENAQDITANDVIALAQFTQKAICVSEQFGKDLTNQITTNLDKYNETYRERVRMLEDYFDKQNNDFKTETGFVKSADIDSMSGPQTLLRAAELLNKYHDYFAQFNSPRVASYNNSTYTRLWNSMLANGELNIKAFRDSMIISNDQDIVFHPSTGKTESNKVSLAKAKFMVLRNDALSDTVQATNRNQLTNELFKSYSTINIPKEKAAKLEQLAKKDKVTLDEVRDIIDISSFRGFNGEVKAYYDSKKHLFTLSFKENFNDLVKAGYAKIGLSTAKYGKATVDNTIFDTTKLHGDDKVMPDFVIGKSLFDRTNGSAFSEATKVGIVTDDDGNEYDVYEFNHLALLEAERDIKSLIADRPEDTISITQGLKGVDAFMNIGSTALEISEDGKVKFNPEGYNELRDSLAMFDLPEFSDVNAMAEINTIRIASMLAPLTEDERTTILYRLGINTTDLNEALTRLYKEKAIGGAYGDSVVEAVMNLIYEVASETSKENIFNSFSKSSLLSRVWSTALEEVAHSYNRSAQDVDADMFFKSKWAASSENARRTRSTISNSEELRLKAMSGSAVSYYDDNYYSRDALLKDLGIKLSKDQWNDIYQAKVSQREQLWPGTQTDLFRGVLKTRGDLLDARKYPETTPYFKTGAIGPVQSERKNLSSGSVYTTPLASRGQIEFDTPNYMNTYKNNLKDGRWNWDYNDRHQAHMYLMPYMYNGTDAQTLYALSNRQMQAEGNIARSVLSVDKDMYVGLDYKAIDRTNLPEYIRQREESLKVPTAAARYKDYIESQRYHLESNNDNLSSVTEIADFLDSKFDGWNKDVLSILELYDDEEDEFLNSPDWQSKGRIFESLVDQDMIDAAIKIWNKDNGVELENSFFNSYGYKAANNAEIGLGNRTLYLGNAVNQYVEKFLGKEYKTLVYIINKEKSIGNIVNKYIDMKVKIDAYESLVNDSKKHIEKNGTQKYNELLIAAKKAIVGNNSSVPFEEAYKGIQTQLSKIESDKVMSKAIKCVNAINQRIIVESQKHNPYSLVPYYSPIYESDKIKKTNILKSYISAYNVTSENSLELINGFRKNGNGSLTFATKLYDSELGYLGMITKVAQQYATTQALKDFSMYLKSNGYMRNSEIYIKAHQSLIETFESEFIDSFTTIENEKRKEYDKQTYAILRDQYNSLMPNGEPISGEYIDAYDFKELYTRLKQLNAEATKGMTRQELEEQYEKYKDSAQRFEAQRALAINDAYENTLSVMLCMLEENKGYEAGTLLSKIYDETIENAIPKGYVLVDSRGARLDTDMDRYPCVSTTDMDDIFNQTKLNFLGNRKAEIAKLMLSGDVYIMRQSVAEQLDQKVFTKQIPGLYGKAIGLAKNYVTSFIMASPMQLLDRTVNFTIFDIGALAQADVRALDYLPLAIATINKYKNSVDSITKETIATDRGLQMLLRYMAASGQSPMKVTNLQGESVSEINIPVIKQFMSLAQNTLVSQQFFARFAYFWDLSENLGADGWLDPTRFGVAFHKQDGLRNIEAGNKGAEVYNSIFDFSQNRFLSFDNANDAEQLQAIMNRDAAALQVVAENVGVFGNMPYGTGVLSKLGFMFTGFPLAAMRWGINRFQSLAYAVQNIGQGMHSGKYMLRNLGSTALVFTLQLAFQILMSPDTRDYIKKRLIEGKSKEEAEEELGEDKVNNAETILWRGGSVKLFDSWLKKEEQTNAAHSRSPLMYLWNNFIADYVLKDEDTSAGDAFWNQIKTHLWGHAPIVIKDPIESIPGNTWLQTTSWYTPSNNFIENMSRKAMGYILGSQQGNAFIDKYKAMSNSNEGSFLTKVGLGLKNAFIDDASGIKEYKSSWRNYKKAFSVIYDYINMTSNYTDSYNDSSDTQYKDLKSDLNNALKEKTSASGFYNVIKKWQDRVDIKTLKSALENCSLRSKLEKISANGSDLTNMFSDNELAIIKSALAYEDYMFPYLSDTIDKVREDYYDQTQYNNKYNNLATILRNYNYNYPRRYSRSYNTNYRRYNQTLDFFKHIQRNYKPYTVNPFEEFNQMQNLQNRGLSTDVWGNQTRYYTDGTTYTVRQQGMPFPGGNK